MSAVDEDQLRDCETYVRQHNVQQMIKDAVVQLCIHKPPRPATFLREYFQRLEYQERQSQSQPPQDFDDEPLQPPPISMTPRRRGAFSAETISEEELARYVKKVCFH